MKLNKLSKVVELIYLKVYNESLVDLIKQSDTIYTLKFKEEDIRIDNSVGNKYRITFNDYVGTILKFRDFIDESLNINVFCCDWSDYIDLTESLIDKLYNNLV